MSILTIPCIMQSDSGKPQYKGGEPEKGLVVSMA